MAVPRGGLVSGVGEVCERGLVACRLPAPVTTCERAGGAFSADKRQATRSLSKTLFTLSSNSVDLA